MNDQSGAMPQVQLALGFDAGAQEGRIQVRVSARARRLSVRVYADARVEVVAPRRVRPAEIERFLAEHRDWIDTRRAAALRNRPPSEPFPPGALDFAATGERWRVHVAGGSGRVRVVEGAGGLLEIRGTSQALAMRRALRAWLMRAAAARLAPRVAALAEAAGVRYARVAVRRQRSRWGSCSARGTISLNACLLFQRAAVVDYLIIHELMHVTHMNHSARFWRAVESHCADWRTLDRELLQGWRTVPRWVFS
jgi:predicted metal-dependent hydrolase